MRGDEWYDIYVVRMIGTFKLHKIEGMNCNDKVAVMISGIREV